MPARLPTDPLHSFLGSPMVSDPCCMCGPYSNPSQLKMPKTTRTGEVKHTHKDCVVCEDFPGVCDLHPECETCLQNDLGRAFTIANLKRECKKTQLEAEHNRLTSREWEARFKRQVNTSAEMASEINDLKAKLKEMTILKSKAEVKAEKSRDAYSRMSNLAMYWKKAYKDLKWPENKDIKNTAAEPERDPTQNLMSLFDAVSNEFEACMSAP
jgi:hypothetical protein